MTNPNVSVLMAVYNAERWLRKAVDSVLCQTMDGVELLAVDDCSTDGSLAMLKDYEKRYPGRVRVFAQKENQGLIVARNIALKHSLGRYICTLDADDWFSPDAIEKAVEWFGNPEVWCVVFRLIMEYPHEAREYPSPLPTTDPITGAEAFRLSLNWTLHGLCMVRRELHMRYPYDISCRLYSDDNTTRLHYLKSPLVAFCQGEYHYLQHPQSSTHAITAQRFLHARANLSMSLAMRREGVSKYIIDQYEHIRWRNYKAQLRLLHTRGNELSAEERRQVHRDMRSLYGTFVHRRPPFLLFELRQWLGAVAHGRRFFPFPLLRK